MLKCSMITKENIRNLLFHFVPGGFGLLALFIYAGETKPNRAYYLSYGYYFTLLGAVLMGACGFMILVELAIRWRTKKLNGGYNPRLPPEFIADDIYKDRQDEFQDERKRNPVDDIDYNPEPRDMEYTRNGRDYRSSRDNVTGSARSLDRFEEKERVSLSTNTDV